MTRVLIVTYDLAEPSRNYEALLERVKSYASWARLGGSSYLILTDKAPVDVRDYIRDAMQEGDKLYVGAAPAPSAWSGMSDDVTSWIHANQR
jgi:hypothetical protein